MTLCRHRSFRILAAVLFSIGLVGLADGTPTTWFVVPLSALVSVMLLPALLRRPLRVTAKAQPHVEATR